MTTTQAFSPATRRAYRAIGRFLVHYLYGMFTTAFNSGTLAVDAAFGLAMGAAVSTDVTEPNLPTVIAIFCGSALRGCFSYFKKNPLPEKLPESFGGTESRSDLSP